MPTVRYTFSGDTREFATEAEAWLERNRNAWDAGLDPNDFPITTDAGLSTVQYELLLVAVAAGETDPAVIAVLIGASPAIASSQEFHDVVVREVGNATSP